MKAVVSIISFIFIVCCHVNAQSKQELSKGKFDSTKVSGVRILADSIENDTIMKPVHSPKKATMRSAIIPGWGQAYNKQYWKIPLVYAIIAVPASTFFYNNTWYKKSKFAYQARVSGDSADIAMIDRKLEVLSTESIRFYRNEFRRSRDYSVLYTLLAWGLNVVDATVSGHLKQFDVSDDLSMKINPIINPASNVKGLSLVFAFKQPSHKMLLAR